MTAPLTPTDTAKALSLIVQLERLVSTVSPGDEQGEIAMEARAFVARVSGPPGTTPLAVAGASLKPSVVLARAADLIAPEGTTALRSAWTQSRRARDAAGNPAEPASSEAVCWCIVGAIQRIAGHSDNNCYEAPELRWVKTVIERSCVDQWNDAPRRKRLEVVTALRKASELANAAGQ